MGIIKGKHGGARQGAGRKRGSLDRVTVNNLLETLEKRTNNRPYEELLIEDFMQARENKDTLLVLKYHTLFMSKLMNNLTKVEVEDTRFDVEAKQKAFQEALAQLTKQ